MGETLRVYWSTHKSGHKNIIKRSLKYEIAIRI